MSSPSESIGTCLRLPPRLLHLIRYASVSAVSTVVGLSTLVLLVGVGHGPAVWANVAATGLGTIPSFELNRRWVWHRGGPRSILQEVFPFAGFCFLELIASTLAVAAASSWTAHADWSHVTRTGVDLAANVLAYGTLWAFQYLVCAKVLFGRTGRDAPDGQGHGQPSTSTQASGLLTIDEGVGGRSR